MAKITIEIQADDHGHGSYDREDLETLRFQESERYTDCVEIYMSEQNKYLHVSKADLKKVVLLLCD